MMVPGPNVCSSAGAAPSITESPKPTIGPTPTGAARADAAAVAAVVGLMVEDTAEAGRTRSAASTPLALASAFVVGALDAAVPPFDAASPVAVAGVEPARRWPSARSEVVPVVALVTD